MSRVLVIGSINMDLVMRTPRLPNAGETLVGGTFSIVPGGKGANQAAAASRLGNQVRMIGAVGEDEFGTSALENLRRQGVSASDIRKVPSISTGVAMILVDEAGENTIVVASGANHCVEPELIAASSLDWADVIVLQCEIPLHTVASTVHQARERGKIVILNAAPAVPDLPAEALQVDYLIVNEQEAIALTGVIIGRPDDALLAAADLCQRGAKHAIVTLGADGCTFQAPSGNGHIPAPKIEAVDTTAAGDAFVGALASAIGRGMALPEVLRYANSAGALAATVLGAQTSLPDAVAVERLFEQFYGTLRSHS